LKLYPAGRLESVVIDDCVPFDAENGGVIIQPPNIQNKLRQHHKGHKTKRVKSVENQVEIWPTLVTKGLAKALGCYERLLNQNLENSLADLTGMPVRSYNTNDFPPTFEFLRDNFKRNYIQIIETSPQFRAELIRANPQQPKEYFNYFILCHPAKPLEEQQMLAFKSPFTKSNDKPTWTSEQYLRVKEDWIKYKRFKQTEQGWYWIPYDQFASKFSRVIVCKYRDDWHIMSRILESKNNGPVACDFRVKTPTSLSIGIFQIDEICADPGYKYSTLRTFLVKLPAENEKDPKQKVQELIKGSYHLPMKCVTIEVKLEPAKYRLICDVESPPSEFGKVFSACFFSEKAISLRQEAAFDAMRNLKEFYSTLAIERGERTELAEDGAMRKYTLSSPKLGLFLSVYANRSRRLCSIVEKLKAVPRGRLSKDLEEGDKLVLSLPANGRKLVTLRYDPKEGYEEVLTVTESAYKAKGHPIGDDDL
jgi:hypothetical protein